MDSHEPEWLGAYYLYPKPLRDGDAVVQPDVVLWLEMPSGALVGTTVIDPRRTLSFGETLERAMRRPLKGPPRRPARIRVPEARLEKELGDAAAGIPVVIAPVPELNATYLRLSAELGAFKPGRAARGTARGEDDFEPVPAPPPSPRAGRNDPCPCGSGKKYKKCHLGADAAPQRAMSEIDRMTEMDETLIGEIVSFGVDRFGGSWAVADFDRGDESTVILVPWAAWTGAVDGTRVADMFAADGPRRLSPEERDWCEAQRGAWLSVWEVTDVAPALVTMRDVLSGQERAVRTSVTVVVGDSVLARVVDYRGASYFSGLHGYPLDPPEADALVASVRRKLRTPTRTAVPLTRLRDQAFSLFLIERWIRAVGISDDLADDASVTIDP